MAQDPSATIAFPREGSVATLLRWIETWNRIPADSEERVLELELDALVTPIAGVMVAAAFAERARAGRRSRVECAQDSDALRDLQRIGFFAKLGIAVPQPLVRAATDALSVPLEPIETLEAARSLAERTRLSLRRQAQLPPSLERLTAFMLEELAANIVQHSRAAWTGFGMARAWPEQRKLQIAFADRGVGFLQTMQRHPELEGRLSDEGEALQLALEKGVSGGDSTNMGMGLALLRSVTDQLHADLWIGSGTALLHRRDVGGKRVHAIQSVPRWQGSWICVEAALPRDVPLAREA